MIDYKNPALSPERRVDDLIAHLNLDEKLAQLHALWLCLDESGEHVPRADQFTGSSDSETIKQRLMHGLGQITRPLGTRSITPLKGVRALNSLQKFLVEETNWGIPVLSHEECLSGLMARDATLFPSSLAYGATWNPDLIHQVGEAIGIETLSVGARQGLAPVLDVARDARWGRTEETFGEDPYLTGVLATRYVQGLQGENRRVLATLKHYVGHSFSEGGRNHAPVHLGWRELNDDFMLPFEMAVKLGNAGSVMPAYHDIDNEPVHASRFLLTDILRNTWGFDGLIVADYVGVTLLQTHHRIAADRAEAAALSFNAGLDVELPGDDCAPHLKEALERGLISLETIDATVKRILLEKFRLGLFEYPYTDEHAINLRSDASLTLARTVAEQSVTIIDNNGVLPLSADSRIAVIGPTANDPLALLGDYSFPVHLINQNEVDDAASVITILNGFQTVCGKERITHAQGCHILETRGAGAPVFPGDIDDNVSLDIQSLLSTRLDLIDEAINVANAADIIVVCIGDLSGIFQTGTVGEGSDADTLDLPGVQQNLLEAIVATGKPVVAVLSSGRPYNLGGLESRLAAQVMTWFGGEQGGLALANVMTGAVEPSGRLTLSVPRSAGASPYFYNHKFKSSGTPIARHFGSNYPFGHGHSYTEFTYNDLSLEKASVDIEKGDIRLSFVLHNAGKRAGIEIPQLYVRDCLASMVRPVKELKGFGRVELATGQRARVSFILPVDMLNFTGSAGVRIVEPGEFEILIGASSADIRLHTRIHVSGPVRILEKYWRMESTCSIEHI
ncbi:MAG: glycoside hydrolase family 3 N-terminal domain-containing protein [Granulosicoccus sp.]